MRVTVVILGLLLALVVDSTVAELHGQVMEKKDTKTAIPQKSQFFACSLSPSIRKSWPTKSYSKKPKLPWTVRLCSNSWSAAYPPFRIVCLEPLVKLLSNKNFKIREQAAKDLLAAGPVAIPLLRPVLSGKDLDTGPRGKIIKGIEQRFPSPGRRCRAPAAELKVLGGVPQLFDFLPVAANDIVEDELVTTMLKLTIDQKKIDPVLIAALKKPNPLQRALAAWCRPGGQRTATRRGAAIVERQGRGGSLSGCPGFAMCSGQKRGARAGGVADGQPVPLR